MTALAPFPLSTLAMLDWLDANFASDLGGMASSSSPMAGVTPLPHAQAYGLGGDRDILSDHPTIEIQVFAATYLAAGNLAERIDVKLLALGGHRFISNGQPILFDHVEVVSPPIEIPWDSENSIRRFQASYSVSIRRAGLTP